MCDHGKFTRSAIVAFVWSNGRAGIKLVVEWDLSRWPASKPPPR
jgi:hypothetical protein